MAIDYNSAAVAANQRELTALFKDRTDADSAYEWLLKNGYNNKDIHLLMSEETRQRYDYQEPAAAETTEKDALGGMETGAVFGGGLGATLGVLAAIGAMVIIPGLGLAVAGPLAASLAGAGGLIGGSLGALYGSGVPEEKAQEIERRIKEGSILISVAPRNQESAAQIESGLQEHGGEILLY
jgi:hypothetical protein